MPKKITASHSISADDVRRYCQTHSIKLTPLRERIFYIIAATEQPLTAYTILEILQRETPKAQVMSVYRVLDFLLENGLIHRIESLNAVMPCNHLFEQHLSQWLICRECGNTEEYALPALQQGIAEIEKHTGFAVTMPTIELQGICANCRDNKPKGQAA